MKMRMIVTAGVAVAAIATSAFGADVEVVRAFDGNRGPGWKAGADLAGAVGPKHVAALTEGGYMVQEKATGKVVSQMTAREFWNKNVSHSGRTESGNSQQHTCGSEVSIFADLEPWHSALFREVVYSGNTLRWNPRNPSQRAGENQCPVTSHALPQVAANLPDGSDSGRAGCAAAHVVLVAR